MSAPRGGTVVSALFPDGPAAEGALVALDASGLPRDLVEVVVSERAAHLYPGRARPPGREALAYAGVGGLVGLVLGSAVSLGLLALPGLAELHGAIAVQLLGPNMTTIAGALLGGAVGLLRRRPLDPRYGRVAAAEPGILVAAVARGPEEASEVAGILERAGGSAIHAEPGSPRGARRREGGA